MDDKNLITAYFEADHDRLDLLFRQFQLQKKKNFARAKSYFKDFFQGLRRHIVWEEEVLFPAFEKKSGMQGLGPTTVMRLEHHQIGLILEEIHAKVREKDPESDEQEKKLLDVLGAHNQKEEHVLYPSIDQLIPEQNVADLFHEMESIPKERFEACCGSHSH